MLTNIEQYISSSILIMVNVYLYIYINTLLTVRP